MRKQTWIWECEHCHHQWLATGIDAPAQCPKCKKRKWHTSFSFTEQALRDAPDDAIGVSIYMGDTLVDHLEKTPYRPSMDELRAICAKPQTVPEPIEQAMCTHSEWSEELGERIACGLPAHSAKTKHGNMRVMG